MNNEFWVQIVGYVVSGVVALIVAGFQHNKTTALLEYRLKQLEDKMDKHNNFMERLGIVETKVEVLNRNGN